MRVLMALVFLLSLLPSTPAGAASLRVAATPDVIADFQRLLAGRRVTDVNHYDGPGSRRDVVELLLVHQALALGGENRPVALVSAPSYRRMLALVADGHADVTGSSVWGNDIDADATHLQASSPLIADGEFAAGFFRAAHAPELDERIRQGRWERLSAVSSHTWTPDWSALQKLGLAHVYDVAEWPSMVRMVGAGRADFLLAPFQPGDDSAIRLEGVVLEPVAGACLPLVGSRYLALPRSEAGNRLRAQLEHGLEQLRRTHAIRRAYTDAGFWSATARACLRKQP